MKVKITGMDGELYSFIGVDNDNYKGSTRSYVRLTSGDIYEKIGWDDKKQEYNKILVNGIDVTKQWKESRKKALSNLIGWTNQRRNELKNSLKTSNG